MKVNILKGTNQIGGCITQITSSKGTKILIDYGKDLEENEKNFYPNIDWSQYKAVFITHIHDDHIGLINEIPHNVDVYVEDVSFELYKVYKDYVNHESVREVKRFKIDCDPIEIGDNDIKVTPKRVDHSAFNSVMYLVEADGKSVLHLGDFRTNGRVGVEFVSTIKEIGFVNLLIMEGTTLSRENRYDDNGNLICNDTEEELCEKIKEVMRKYDLVLILQSSLNIDRIRTMYEAAIDTGKILVQDIFTAVITDTLNNYDDNDYNVPCPNNEKYNVRIYVPGNRDKKRNKDFKDDIDKYIYETYVKNMKDKTIYYDISRKNLPVALMIKTSWNNHFDGDCNEIAKLRKWGRLDNACLIYSMWDGYRFEEGNSTKKFVDELEKVYKLPIIPLHTSGHADSKARDLLFENLKYNKLLPIHTTEKAKYKEKFNNVEDIEDGEEVEVI